MFLHMVHIYALPTLLMRDRDRDGQSDVASHGAPGGPGQCASVRAPTRCKTQSKMLTKLRSDSESKQRFLGGFGVVNSWST